MKRVIYKAIIHGMKQLIFLLNNEGIKINELKLTNEISNLSDDACIDLILAAKLKKLWSTDEIQFIWKNRGSSSNEEFDNLDCYLDEIERIGSIGYIPNRKNILSIRNQSGKFAEYRYLIEHVKFHFINAGNQIKTMKKWIHQFDEVTAVVFVVALDEYDCISSFDPNKTKLDESLDYFDEICNLSWNEQSCIFLYLNKRELFRKKLLTTPINNDEKNKYTDFRGPFVIPETPSAIEDTKEFERCYDAAINYIRDKFFERNRKHYIHISYFCISTIDEKDVATAFDTSKNRIFMANLIPARFSDP